jgi:predicted DNA-binding protein YlxM (UPF0122 family)
VKLVALLKQLTRVVVKLRTRVFELYNEDYSGLVELAQAMGISKSQIYRVRQGTQCP